jgi:hypothetical protein
MNVMLIERLGNVKDFRWQLYAHGLHKIHVHPDSEILLPYNGKTARFHAILKDLDRLLAGKSSDDLEVHPYIQDCAGDPVNDKTEGRDLVGL